MAYIQKPFYFSLFPNKKKEKDTQPDWKGSITLPDGTEHWFDAWNKVSPNTGEGYLSGKIGNPKQNQSNVNQPSSFAPFPASAPANPIDDDIPF